MVTGSRLRSTRSHPSASEQIVERWHTMTDEESLRLNELAEVLGSFFRRQPTVLPQDQANAKCRDLLTMEAVDQAS
jgi:hypothetical protein